MKRPVIAVGGTALVLLALTACGSTVSAGSLGSTQTSTAAGAALSDGLSDGLSAPLVTPSESASGTPTDLAHDDAPPSETPTDESTTDSGGDGYTYAPAAPAVVNGPGVSASTISIGLAYSPDSDQNQAALGNTTSTSGDQHAMMEALVRDVNAHGGIGHRKLAVVYDAISTAGNANKTSAQLATEVCAYFSQDHKVLMTLPLTLPEYIECMDKRGAVTAGGSTAGLSSADFASHPSYWDVLALPTDVVARTLVDYLVSHDYFAKWDARQGQPGSAPMKLGILAPDNAAWVKVTPQVLVPYLRKRGIAIDDSDVKIWHFPDSVSGNAGAVTEIQGTVLKMRADGVTHLIATELNGLTFFAAGAESQGYRPRYGISTADTVNSFAGGLLPYRQLNGAVGVGWDSILDQPDAYNPNSGPFAGPGRPHCVSVMKAAGITFANATEQAIALVFCDIVYGFRDAVNAVPTGSAITKSSVMRGLESLGSSFKAGGLKAVSYARGKHYPVVQVYDLRYYGDCKCTHYASSKPIPLS